jgi:PAS domain S-box-containing protein
MKLMKSQIQVGDIALSLDEAAETLRAIRQGSVDAVVVAGRAGHEVFTFREPSHPYRLLVEAMSEGAALVTSSGIICYHNPHFAELVEAPGVSLCGRLLSELVPPQGASKLGELLQRATTVPARDEIKLIGKEGRTVPVQLSVSPALLADIPVFCVVATDISEHKRQEALCQAARLEIEARDRLFAVAAHELRGPLGAIEMQTHLLRMTIEKTPLPAEKAMRMVESINRQGKELSELVNKLLDIGTIGAGRLQLGSEEVDLSDAVRVVAERCADLINRSGCTLALELQPVVGHWDRVRLEQVIANLVSNAAKYGLGRPIRVVVQGDEGLARLVVEDQGGGISTSDRELLFQPYRRMASSRGIPGLGLGLYIASEIVKAHGGTIRVESEVGVGSRFLVELPLSS